MAARLGSYNRPERPTRAACRTCHGTGRFVPSGKAHEVAVVCPRCRGAQSVHTVPESQRPWHRLNQ